MTTAPPASLPAALRALADHLDAHPDLDPAGIAAITPIGRVQVQIFSGWRSTTPTIVQLARWAASLGITQLVVRRTGSENHWVHLHAEGTLADRPIEVWGTVPELVPGDLPDETRLALADLPAAVDAATAARARADAALLTEQLAPVVPLVS